MGSWLADHRGKAKTPFRSGSPRAKLPEPSALPYEEVLPAANPRRIFLDYHAGYTTDWHAEA